MNKNYDYKKLCPFKWFVLQNFPFLDYDFDQITNWQLLQKLGEKINEIIESQNDLGQEMEQLVSAFNSLKDYVDNYFENLDIQEEINNKLDELVRDGTIESMLDRIFTPLFDEQQQEIETLTINQGKMYNKIAQNTSRINEIANLSEGSTSGDAELVDIRVGYTGQIFESAGKAVRKQTGQNDYFIRQIANISPNLYNPNDTVPGILGSNGDNYYSDTYALYKTTDFIFINDASYVSILKNKAWGICFYDENKNFIERLTSTAAPVDTAFQTLRTVSDVEIQAKYIKVVFNSQSPNYNESMIVLGNNIDIPYSAYGVTKIKQNNIDLDINNFYNTLDPVFFPRGIKQCAWRGITYAINPNTGYLAEYAEENSYPAYKKAINEKMDFLWLAVIRYSNDNEFYIMHDATTERTCTSNITIAESSSAQIDAVRLKQKGWIQWSDDDLKIPKLEDVIKLCLQNNINIGFRLGALPSNILTQDRKEIWDKFYSIIKRYNLYNCVFSGSLSQISVLNSYNNNLLLQITSSTSNTEQDNLNTINTLINKHFFRASIIIYKTNLTDACINLCKNNNISIFIPTTEPIATNEDISFYKEKCFDGIITHTKIDFNT